MNESSLTHPRWDCVYHIAWMPKRRRKVMYGQLRREVVEILEELVVREDGVGIVESGACPDHIRICLRIPPKYAVRKAVGRLKGCSSIMPHEWHPEWRRAMGGARPCGRAAAT